MRFKLRDNTYVVGDMHGDLSPLMFALSISTSSRYLPDNSDIVLLGDCGIVNNGIPNDYRHANKKARARGIRIFVFRGNHDNPATYRHELSDNDPQLSNVYILEDLDELELADGRLGIVIPGAVSIDRSYRWENNWCWFEGERIPDISHLDNPDRYSVIFSHGGPRPPIVSASRDSGFFDTCCSKDKNLLRDLEEEQEQWRCILEMVRPERVYMGHYHCSDTFTVGDVTCRVCDIGEIVPVM